MFETNDNNLKNNLFLLPVCGRSSHGAIDCVLLCVAAHNMSNIVHHSSFDNHTDHATNVKTHDDSHFIISHF